MISCEAAGEALVLEWDPARTAARLIFAVIDAELGRFASGRTVELLTPLPEELLARVAADGLGTPEIASNRVLETLLERTKIA